MNSGYELPMIEDWIFKIYEEGVKEDQSKNQMPFVLLYSPQRAFVWNVCNAIGVFGHGIPATVCEFLQQYIYATSLDVIHSHNGAFDEEVCNQHMENTLSKLSLMIAASIFTAVKMYVTRDNVNIMLLSERLYLYGLRFTSQEIMQAEFDILKAYNFSLPIWTSLDTARMISHYLNLPQYLNESVEQMMNITEFNRNFINTEIQLRRQIPQLTLERRYLLTVHLAAGAVYATVISYQYEQYVDIRKMEEASHTPISFIQEIAAIIITLHHF